MKTKHERRNAKLCAVILDKLKRDKKSRANYSNHKRLARSEQEEEIFKLEWLFKRRAHSKSEKDLLIELIFQTLRKKTLDTFWLWRLIAAQKNAKCFEAHLKHITTAVFYSIESQSIPRLIEVKEATNYLKFKIRIIITPTQQQKKRCMLR